MVEGASKVRQDSHCRRMEAGIQERSVQNGRSAIDFAVAVAGNDCDCDPNRRWTVGAHLPRDRTSAFPLRGRGLRT